MREEKGEQKSLETLGLLHLFFVFIYWAMVLFKKYFWKILQHLLKLLPGILPGRVVPILYLPGSVI